MTPVLLVPQHALLGGAELHLVAAAQYFRESSAVVLFAHGPLRARLQQAGVDVRVADTPWAQEGTRGGVPRLSARGIIAVLRLASSVAAQARRYDVIYANSPKALTVAWLAGWFARRPVLWAFHDLLDPAHFSRPAIHQMITIGNRGADRVVACSHASVASLIRYGAHSQRITVVYQGMDAAFTKDTRSFCALRRELCLGDGPIVGVFGRVTQWKGQHIAIEVLSRLPQVWLLIVGDTSEEPTYADALRRRSVELGVGDRVRLLEHRDDVPELMRLVDVVLHTPVAPEPFGRVIVEGMLARRPVVASNAGGAPEIIEDGVSGILVPPADVDGFAAAVSALLHDPEHARAIAEAGFAHASTRFTLESMLAALACHVDEVARQ
jgi:glycosyltransferase involved in cell wall biosynthesis